MQKAALSTDGTLLFWCPGCDEPHGIGVRDSGRPRPVWDWNGSLEAPTATPSILVQSTVMTEKGKAEYEAWAEAGCPGPSPRTFETVPRVCHSYLVDGRIQFLSDCTHALAGQTVDLPGWDDNR